MKRINTIQQYRDEIAEAKKAHSGNKLQRIMSEATRRANGLIGWRKNKQASGSFGN